jgi:cytochrome oxidase Cu insertion factor (SCO1/SenC/PrrC family)
MHGGRRLPVVVALAALLGGALAAAAVLAVAKALGKPAEQVPASVQARLGLFTLHKQAPGFTLTDQRGRRLSLAQLRGRAVVLEFFDPVCTDICPIVSQEYVDAARLLGSEATRTAFLAVNVNQYHERIGDVARFSRAHGLDAIAGFHFLTGSTPALEAVWKAYGVAVQPNRTGDVVHSSLLYFIDPSGRIRYLAWPQRAKGAAILDWGSGIATVVRTLL